jgi:hypothetical protein
MKQCKISLHELSFFQEYDNQTKVEDKLMKVNQLEAKVQIKETELHEVREKFRVLNGDYEKLKEQNKNLLRRVTNEQFERYLNFKFYILEIGTANHTNPNDE